MAMSIPSILASCSISISLLCINLRMTPVTMDKEMAPNTKKTINTVIPLAHMRTGLQNMTVGAIINPRIAGTTRMRPTVLDGSSPADSLFHIGPTLIVIMLTNGSGQ